MSDDTRKTKTDLLEELESIKGLLLDLDEDEIPLLLEEENDDIPLLEEIVDPDAIHTRRQPARANGENPFLPQHIRARLKGNNPLPMQQLELPQTATNGSKELLIQAVIQTLQPQIEKTLREQLQNYSPEALKRLLD